MKYILHHFILIISLSFLPTILKAQCETLSIPYNSSVQANGQFIYQGPQIFGLGWSKSSAMAYMVHGVHKSTQTEYTLILVQDMVTDNKEDLLYLDTNIDSTYVHDPCLVLQRTDVLEKLSNQGIQIDQLGILHPTSVYAPFQFVLNTAPSSFTCAEDREVNALEYTLNFYEGDEYVKTIGGNIGGEEHLKILGYIKSPFEPRLAVIVETKMTSCGEDKAFADIAIYGCKVN